MTALSDPSRRSRRTTAPWPWLRDSCGGDNVGSSTKGVHVHTVLGLSMTPTSVGFVLVEGQGTDGATVDHEAFEVDTSRGRTPVDTSEQVTAAVLRTQEIADLNGHPVQSVGVTWSDDANTEAALLLKSLTDSGFENVVAVRLPEATEALARGIGRVIGYEKTAVCVIEPYAVIVLGVDTRDGAVQTAVNHTLHSDDDLVWWLNAIFDRDDWQPEALVIVGSDIHLDAITAQLEEALSIPVFAPAEAQLALARGAALASAHNLKLIDLEVDESGADQARPDRPLSRSHTGALAMLGAGVVTFVVSLSIAVGLQLTPDKGSGQVEHRDVANTSGAPAAVHAVAPPAALPPAQAVTLPAADPPLAPPPPEAPPISEAPPQVDIPEAPPADLPSAESMAPAPQDQPAPPPVALPPAPPPPVALPPVAPVQERPGILTRIRERLHRDQYQPPDQSAPVLPPASDLPVDGRPPPP
jgi:hypothetical protein